METHKTLRFGKLHVPQQLLLGTLIGSGLERNFSKTGGFGITNNPTREGVFEIEEASGAESVGIVVSVGTARNDKLAKKNIVSKIKSKLDTGTDPTIIHNEMVEKSGLPKYEGMSYFRLNPTEKEFRLDIALDEWSPRTRRFSSSSESGRKTIKKIEETFYRWKANHWVSQTFDDCAAELVRCRRARTGDGAKWERYATGAEYTCRIQGCPKGEAKFYDRGDFEDHLQQVHQSGREERADQVKQSKKAWVYRPPGGR